jgi:hypothetical protein
MDLAELAIGLAGEAEIVAWSTSRSAIATA